LQKIKDENEKEIKKLNLNLIELNEKLDQNSKRDFAFKKKIRLIDGERNKYEVFYKELPLGKGLNG
jgi:chromosome segregation ATPase